MKDRIKFKCINVIELCNLIEELNLTSFYEVLFDESIFSNLYKALNKYLHKYENYIGSKLVLYMEYQDFDMMNYPIIIRLSNTGFSEYEVRYVINFNESIYTISDIIKILESTKDIHIPDIDENYHIEIYEKDPIINESDIDKVIISDTTLKVLADISKDTGINKNINHIRYGDKYIYLMAVANLSKITDGITRVDIVYTVINMIENNKIKFIK